MTPLGLFDINCLSFILCFTALDILKLTLKYKIQVFKSELATLVFQLPFPFSKCKLDFRERLKPHLQTSMLNF